MKKVMAFLVLVLTVAALLVGCSEAERVSQNVSQQADSFNVTRRVVVINTRTDKVLLEVIGLISIQHSEGDVDIIVEVADGLYKKHFVSLNQWTTYTVEDINGAYVDKYHYELNYLPEMIVPVKFISTP